jgi:hypothetical protein
VVDLPAPVGAEEAVDLALGDLEADPADGLDLVEPADQVGCLDCGRHAASVGHHCDARRDEVAQQVAGRAPARTVAGTNSRRSESDMGMRTATPSAGDHARGRNRYWSPDCRTNFRPS